MKQNCKSPSHMAKPTTLCTLKQRVSSQGYSGQSYLTEDIIAMPKTDTGQTIQGILTNPPEICGNKQLNGKNI